MIDILRDIDRYPADCIGMAWSLYLVLYSYTYPTEKHPVLAVMWGIDLNLPWCSVINYSGKSKENCGQVGFEKIDELGVRMSGIVSFVTH